MRLTHSEAVAYQARWAEVNAAEVEELRRTSPTLKLRQLASLMASVGELGWREALASEDETVRDRWLRLRQSLGACFRSHSRTHGCTAGRGYLDRSHGQAGDDH